MNILNAYLFSFFRIQCHLLLSFVTHSILLFVKNEPDEHLEEITRIKKNLMHKRLVLVQIYNGISKAKLQINCPKSVFGVATKRYNKGCYTTWHEVKQILNIILWKIIPYCLHVQLKFVVKVANHISHTRSVGDIPCEQAGQGRSLIRWAKEKSGTVFATCGRSFSCWKTAQGMPWRKGTTSGCSTVPVTIEITLNS